VEVAESPTEAPARFDRGEPVTIVVTATADAEYEACAPGGTTVPMLEAQLPSKSVARMTVPCDAYPGVRVIHGDISPTLIQALRDAIDHHDGCTDAEHVGWREQYERLLDALGAAET
jgi:hypothetical protein